MICVQSKFECPVGRVSSCLWAKIEVCQSIRFGGLGFAGGFAPGGGGGGLGLGGPSSIPPGTCEVSRQSAFCGSHPANILFFEKNRRAIT